MLSAKIAVPPIQTERMYKKTERLHCETHDVIYDECVGRRAMGSGILVVVCNSVFPPDVLAHRQHKFQLLEFPLERILYTMS